jgi:TP901 family phage tail tape measure protein
MAMDADVRLLIGVARGGADGDSEALIRKELNEIMGKIKLEAKLDSKSFGEQIRKQLDAISKNGKFYVNLSKINIGAGAIADFRRQLNTVINTLNLDKGTSITLTAEGIGEVKSKIKETATVTDEAARKIAEFNVQIAAMKKQSKNIDTGLGSLSKGATAEEAAQVTALLERYKAWQVEFETLRLQGVDGSNERRKALEDEAAAILVNIQRINEEREATAEAAQAKVQAEREAKAADDATVTAENRKNAAMKQGVMLLTQMQKAEQDWTAAQSGRSSEHYNNIRQGTVYLQEYLGQLERGEISVDEFQRRLAGLRTSFAESSNAVKSAGENTKTLSERVGGLAAKFTSWLTVSQIVMKLYSSLKKMVSAVIDIDTAMTELKKVTDETSTVYAKYLDDASVRAKKLGATIADTVTASADFARLGYTLDEAAQLADAALVYKNVGDGIEDVSQASESIISTMKAFGIEAENAISIVDKFNEVGNNFAISSEGVGEALRRSASALAAGNNTLDESIALITAANSVVQDADVVGTTMKTVSMYLRAAKTEAEEAGESTEGMANSVSELREELLALTNGKVDIQIDENTFKSTYQIMKELADVWGELTDITQANILEQIGGKRNANVVSSMLENFNVAEDVVKTAANSAGSALKENEKYLDSINGKIAEFKATFEELSMNFIDSDFVKQVIELGTGLLNVLNVLAKVIDKVGGLNTVLYVTVGILATIKADAIKTFLVTTLPGAIAKVTSAISTFVAGFKQLPTVIKAMNSQTALAVPGTSKLSVALKTLGISASTAQIAVGALMAVLTAAIIIYQAHKRAQEELRQEAITAANAAAEESNELAELTNKYIDLTSAMQDGNDVSEDLLSVKDQLIKKLDLESDKVKELVGDYADLNDKIKAATVVELQNAERDIRGGLNAYETELVNAAKPSLGTSMNSMSKSWNKKSATKYDSYKALQALEAAGYISSGSYSYYTDDADKKYSLGFAMYLPEEGFDLSTVDGIIAAHERLAEMLDIVQDKAGSTNEVYTTLYEQYNKVSEAIGNYENSIGDLNNNLAEQYMLQGLIGKELPSTQEEYDAYRQRVIDSAKESGEFIGSDTDIEAAVDSVLGQQAQFADFYNQAIADTTSGTGVYTASLSNLADILSDLQSAYDLVNTAEEEMATGGLSPETINALAAANKDYIDYLYEENGVIKLNTEAWMENANAKMQEQMAEIEKETESLKEQNAALEEKNRLLDEQAKSGEDYYDQYGSDGGAGTERLNAAREYRAEIEENNRVIEENNLKIAENQGKLAIYSSLYGSITGDLDAYTSALNNFSRISNTINSVSDSFQTLANLQNQVADGFTMSLDKALEFASVYPEILNNATVAADGQLTLNADVVNSFIAGKKAELDAQIDSQITQLEADKAVLTAKMESAQAQLELAKNVGDGEGQIAKEVAEYRINTGNALTAALIEMGVEESKAYALAAAAMAGNEEEFARVAKECFENMDDNAAKAAYNMAHSIFVNASNSCNSISEIAAQAHETAQAIAAMGSGEVAGSSSSIFGGTDGTQTGGLSLDLYKGNFKGTDYNYEATSVSLDDYVSQLELDISSYEKAIAQIDGQIAALQALKNAPLKSFESSSGSSGSGGSSKEVEEYLADIDEYYEAMKRLESIQQRLAKLQSQIEYADTEEEKIALTKQLINVYNDEADALENLNSLRSETIANGKAELEALGFSVSYDATTNEFMVHNMEHLNELYGATQEETNELRKKTEELIDTMESLNDSNQEGASSLRTLKADIKSAKQSIIDYLKQIVTAASDVVDAYQNVYETLHNAADEYAANGYITIDTLQSIIELGAQYMQYLMDENGLLVINEENINKVLAAKTQELALNQAMTYVERLRLALQENSIEDLNNLLYATTEATNATWGLVYANLALLGLDDDQYQAALHNINAIRSLADSAVSGIGQTAGKTAEELNNMKDGLDDILKYVMDMLKQRINDQIDALEDMKDAYADIISLRKEALEAAKSEADYQDKVAEKVKALAKLQARINALSLDDSRDAQAQKAKLEEEMSQLQKELADTQSDYAVDAQKSALDNMQKAYEEQKNAEIKVLEDSISSYQKLYDMAIAYIQSNWGSLYDELIAWNYQYGDELSSTITTAWENALAAAQRYGSYVNALNSIGADIDAANGAGSNYIVGETTYDNSSSNEEMIHAIIKEMYANSQAHHTASKEEKARLDKRNLTLGAMLGQYGVNAYRQNGTWYVDGGALLYEKYRKYIYHTGGIAGDQPTLKQNEILAVLEKGEAVLDAKKEAGLYRIIDFTTALSDKLSKLLTLTDMSRMFGQMQGDVTKAASAFAPINNTQIPSVSFGDVIIYGANEETVEKHREINRQFTNDVIKQLNIKR